jgi:DNA-binding NtrC family response regulator
MLLPHLHQPIVTRCAGDRLALQPIEHTGTLVLHSVGTLDRDDQRRLIEWLDRPWPRPQVVSTSPAPLLAEVERGVFFDSLYYRLNTVCLQL